MLSHLILTSRQRGSVGYLFVLNEETKDREGYTTSPGAHSLSAAALGLEPRCR